MASKTQVQLMKELDLLVNTGLGIAPIAPGLCELLAKIIGANASGMCWFDEIGTPEGFYQKGSPRSVEELFMNHYAELFVGPYEYTPFWCVRNKAKAVGNTIFASRQYLRSNTYNLLIKPSHCHFLLDAVVDLHGATRLTTCFFRAAENPFTPADAEKLTALIPLLRSAIVPRAAALASHSVDSSSGHIVLAADGQCIDMIDAAASRLLSSLNLFDQNLTLARSGGKPPRFIELLCMQLRQKPELQATTRLEIPGGTLVLGACWLDIAPPVGVPTRHLSAPRKILVSVRLEHCSAMSVVRGISAMRLSPLQSRIAMYAAAGGNRSDCGFHHAVSNEALKKHLREIYAASRSTGWHELAATLQALPERNVLAGMHADP